ncbi:cytochrome P450 [Paracoccus pacificus]|uniref:Cytochrome P450 n=1 Tax=Paracoccus pacificus TaxID=1463598 RepID=A0ABW4R488_9RHOB
MIPPKPPARQGRASLLRLVRDFRRDLLSALPQRLYRAWMAEYRTPVSHSFLCNDPALITEILRRHPENFPKSDRLRDGLAPLLGQSIFVTNGAVWRHQRRIIDPAFEGGRLREVFPALRAATAAASDRIAARADLGPFDIEPMTSHAAADAIFRALFSIPIEDRTAAEVFAAFREHQETQPVISLATLFPLPRWIPRPHQRRTRKSAARIRGLITRLVDERADAIAAGTAPDDLATRIMTTPDPETGQRFSRAEMVDQVAIFFLAGHETSASALAWALYLLARAPEWQDRVASEAAGLSDQFSSLSTLRDTRAVFREAMRLYPPVPMFMRRAACPAQFRGRTVPKGSEIVISPWHLHRHERLWDRPDAFDPGRFDTENGRACLQTAYLPFSAGPRVCPGAGFAMAEGVLMLATLCGRLRFTAADPEPVPVARLTVRARDGILLTVTPRIPTPARPSPPGQ